MDWIILLVLVAYTIIAFAVNLKILMHFEHEDDSTLDTQIVLGKACILLGLQLMWLMIIALPLDVYNLHSPLAVGTGNAGLDMRTFWVVIWWFVALYLLLLLPFSIFYYEADFDPRVTKSQPWKKSLFMTLGAIIITTGLIAGIYFLTRSIHLVIDQEQCSPASLSEASVWVRELCTSWKNSNEKPVIGTVDFSTYLIFIMAFVGWWLFALFGGIGLAALPIDLIVGFIYRPKPISQPVYEEKRQELGEKARQLREAGNVLRSRQEVLQKITGSSARTLVALSERRRFQRDKNRFKQAVFILEKEYKELHMAAKERGENPAFSLFKLIAGVFCLLLTVLWIAHIISAIVIPSIMGNDTPTRNQAEYGFLDIFLTFLAKHDMALLALLLYGVFTIYLVMTVMKGCFKFGLRCFCLSIHPMKKDDTHLNSILFNVALILISCSAIIQFTCDAFQSYAAGTDAHWIFMQMEAISFLGLFFKYNIFVYFLLTIFSLATIYLIIKPRERLADAHLDFGKLPEALTRTLSSEPANIDTSNKPTNNDTSHDYARATSKRARIWGKKSTIGHQRKVGGATSDIGTHRMMFAQVTPMEEEVSQPEATSVYYAEPVRKKKWGATKTSE